jgi:predicted LPLAT superfamily acyltransferase
VWGRGYGIEVKVVMHEDNAPMIRAALARLNPEAVADVIPAGTAEAMLRVQECLARGGVVGILGDRVVNPAHIVECPFLGRPAAFPAGTFRLASSWGFRWCCSSVCTWAGTATRSTSSS